MNRFLFVLSVLVVIEYPTLRLCNGIKFAEDPIRLRPTSSKQNIRELLCDPAIALERRICSIVTVYQHHATKQHHRHSSLLEEQFWLLLCAYGPRESVYHIISDIENLAPPAWCGNVRIRIHPLQSVANTARIKKFQDAYRHQSQNGHDYEAFCFWRWLMLDDFILSHPTVTNWLVIDADVLLLSPSTFLRPILNYDVVPILKGAMGMFTPRGLHAFANHIESLYTEPYARLRRAILTFGLYVSNPRGKAFKKTNLIPANKSTINGKPYFWQWSDMWAQLDFLVAVRAGPANRLRVGMGATAHQSFLRLAGKSASDVQGGVGPAGRSSTWRNKFVQKLFPGKSALTRADCLATDLNLLRDNSDHALCTLGHGCKRGNQSVCALHFQGFAAKEMLQRVVDMQCRHPAQVDTGTPYRVLAAIKCPKKPAPHYYVPLQPAS